MLRANSRKLARITVDTSSAGAHILVRPKWTLSAHLRPLLSSEHALQAIDACSRAGAVLIAANGTLVTRAQHTRASSRELANRTVNTYSRARFVPIATILTGDAVTHALATCPV
eukprot:COSAG06_NODE_26870_length_606_cov_0.429980_1_plen_113_part_01